MQDRRSMLLRAGLVAALLGSLMACQTPAPPAAQPVAPWALPDGVKTLGVNGYPMAFQDKGSGPTVLLVHGAMCDYRCFATLMNALPESLHVVSVSLRHYYPEPWDGSGSTYTVAQHAQDLAALARQFSPPVSVVAHSYGGSVAVEMARTNPGLVSRLVLAEAATDGLLPAPTAQALEGRQRFADATEKLLKTQGRAAAMAFGVDTLNGPGSYARYPAVVQTAHVDNAWTLVAGARAAVTPLSCADLGALKMPVLLATGENTSPRYKQLVQQQQQCLPAARTLVVPGVGHAMIGNPAFLGAVNAFLAGR